MAEEKRKDIILEDDTASWSFRLEGKIKGTYSGTFKFRTYLSPLHQIAANREYRELLGPSAALVDEHASFLAYALTQLKYRVIESPPFWRESVDKDGIPGNIADEEILNAILNAAIDAEVLYKKQLNEVKEASISRAKSAAKQIEEDQRKEDDEDDEAEDDAET